MPRLPHAESPGACYFVTAVTSGRREVFRDPANCQLLVDVIYSLRCSGRFLLAGFAIMPDHLHIALLPTNSPVAVIVKEIKRGTARLINMKNGGAGSVWQADYWDRGIERQDELMQKLSYMLANPYRAGLLEADQIYPWVTGNTDFETDLETILGG